MTYLNTDEVEDVIISKSNTYSSLSKIIELPKTSVEGRKIHAIIIGKNNDNKSLLLLQQQQQQQQNLFTLILLFLLNHHQLLL